MFPGHTYQSHYTVTEDGSLNIKGAVRKDEGHYVCSAISQAGASTATVFLQVRKPCNPRLDGSSIPCSTITYDPENLLRHERHDFSFSFFFFFRVTMVQVSSCKLTIITRNHAYPHVGQRKSRAKQTRNSLKYTGKINLSG